MLDKDDYVSRKFRSYLKEKTEYEENWNLYFYIKGTVVFDEWPKLNLNKTESKCLERALEDWKAYQTPND